MQRLRWKSFGNWLIEQNADLDLILIFDRISVARMDANAEKIEELLDMLY